MRLTTHMQLSVGVNTTVVLVLWIDAWRGSREGVHLVYVDVVGGTGAYRLDRIAYLAWRAGLIGLRCGGESVAGDRAMVRER